MSRVGSSHSRRASNASLRPDVVRNLVQALRVREVNQGCVACAGKEETILDPVSTRSSPVLVSMVH
jgi:hypothetical protein